MINSLKNNLLEICRIISGTTNFPYIYNIPITEDLLRNFRKDYRDHKFRIDLYRIFNGDGTFSRGFQRVSRTQAARNRLEEAIDKANKGVMISIISLNPRLVYTYAG